MLIFEADMVKPLRDDLGWTQEDLKDYIGCKSVRSISAWENGSTKRMRRAFRLKFIELRKKADKELGR